MSQIDARYITSDSDTDTSLDSNVTDVSLCDVTGAEVSIEEIDDIDLEEVMTASPVPKTLNDSINSDRNVRRKIALPGE